MSGRDDIDELEELGRFDRARYLLRNLDVGDADLDPSLHFIRFGWHEGRRPNRYSDPVQYLEQSPDVHEADINPLLHYARHGEHEGRRPTWHFDLVWYRAA